LPPRTNADDDRAVLPRERAAIVCAAAIALVASGAAVAARSAFVTPPALMGRSRTTGEDVALRHLVAAGLPLRCGGTRGHWLALSFDDGPGPRSGLVVRILARAHARATFFLVGKQLRYWPRVPNEEARIAALGDHTWSHLDLLGRPSAQVRAELLTTLRAIRAATGRRVTLFRPPYGAVDARVIGVARSLGLATVLWSIDTRDSLGARWDQIAAAVERWARPGSIILLHDNHGQTVRALRYAILPFLARHRLTPVTIPQLLALDPPTRAELAAGLPGCYPHGPLPGSVAPAR
jgi:peptidoglycan/xylan/chitin deacetylase (PgdA/CDA1 family)